MMKKIKFLPLAILLFSSVQAQTLKDAIRLNENEQHDQANAMYQQLISKEPANGILYYYAGENMIDADNTDSAAIYFRNGLQKDASQQLLQIGNAELMLLKGQINEAKAAIDAAVKSAPKNALVHMEAGEALMRYKSKDLISAQLYIEQAVKLDPKNPEVYNLMGDVYSELNDGTQAASNYNKSLDMDKTQVKPYLHKGQLYKRSHSYESAIAEFESALKIDPNFAPAYRELGETYYLQRKIEKAKENYRKYLELSRNNSSARVRYALFLFYTENFKDALTELQQIPKADSANLGQMRLGAYLNYENNNQPEAEQLIAKVFDLTTQDTTKRITLDYVYYGKILSKGGNDSLGAQVVQRAYEMDTTRTELLQELGNIQMRAKNYPQAAVWFQKRVDSGDKVSTTDYYNLGRAYYLMKEYGKSDSAFAKVTSLQETWAPGWLWRGKANTGLDPDSKQGLAKPYYEKYIEIVSADTANITKYQRDLVESNRYLAYYYLVQKDCGQSTIYWKKVLELEPGNEQAKDALEIIKKNPKENCR